MERLGQEKTKRDRGKKKRGVRSGGGSVRVWGGGGGGVMAVVGL